MPEVSFVESLVHEKTDYGGYQLNEVHCWFSFLRGVLHIPLLDRYEVILLGLRACAHGWMARKEKIRFLSSIAQVPANSSFVYHYQVVFQFSDFGHGLHRHAATVAKAA
ncbi:uncharacterized protein LOC124672592 [Lolium rigidum]|uniref:uncharacterized protein LOC124672592 n=1 Tax=Lolium rigidum TaxID=89674 RepID=UPI001F5CA6AC|nr:uncharacterized protein LOC124672592 [Lolium rigidum]